MRCSRTHRRAPRRGTGPGPPDAPDPSAPACPGAWRLGACRRAWRGCRPWRRTSRRWAGSGSRCQPRRSPGSTRTPRAQSPAAISFFPSALTSPRSTAWVAVPTQTLFLSTRTSPAARSTTSDAGRTGPSLIRSPRNSSTPPARGCRPGSGGRRAWPGRSQRTRASSTRIFGARLTPSAACGTGTSGAGLDARRAWRPAGPPRRPASRPRRSPAVSVGRDGLGDDAEDRAGVQALLEAEGAGAGDLVTGHDGVLDGGRAAPGRQQREVQVHPAVRAGRPAQPGGSGRRRRRSGAASGRDLGEPVEELGIARPRRAEGPRCPLIERRSRATGEGVMRRPRPAGASGRVRTATTSWREASDGSSEGDRRLRGAREQDPHQPRPGRRWSAG